MWRNRSGAADHYRQWWRCFDVTVRRETHQSACWVSADLFISEATWRGTHVGDFLGIPATGKAIVQPFVVVVSFRDQLMAGERFYYDLASLVRQLGRDRLPELVALGHRAAA